MGIGQGNDRLSFRAASDEENKGFTPDASPLAHYMRYGPPSRGAQEDATVQAARRDALSRLIDGAFQSGQTLSAGASGADPFGVLMEWLATSSSVCHWPVGGIATPALASASASATGGLLSPQALPDDLEKLAIIGVIDHAIPFAHEMLTVASGHSRVAAVWMQGASPAPGGAAPADIGFGRELLGRDLDSLRLAADGAAMTDELVYRRTGALGFRPAGPGQGQGQGQGRLGPGLAGRLSHGAAITGLAAGMSPHDPDCRSLPVIAVSLPDHLVADTSGAFAPYFVQAAIIYIVNRARRLAVQLQQAGRKTRAIPLVINLSFGVTAGPRDGSLGLVQLQDLIARDACDDLDPVHFVLPSGNHRLERLHGQIRKGQSVLWQVPPDDPTPNVVEIWGSKQYKDKEERGIELTLTLPGGNRVTTDFGARPDGLRILTAPDGVEIARAYRQLRRIKRINGDDEYWRQCLTVISAPTVPRQVPGKRGGPSGLWRIEVAEGPSGWMDIDVQRDDRLSAFPGIRRQSRLYAEDYRPLDHAGRVVEDDPASTHSVLRRRGSANAYGSGDSQLRVGGGVSLDRIMLSPTLDKKLPEGAKVASYSGLLPSGKPGDILAPSDRSPCLKGLTVMGCRAGSSGALSGTSVAAPQVARWLAQEIIGGAPLKDRAAVIAHLGSHGARLRGPGKGRRDPIA